MAYEPYSRVLCLIMDITIKGSIQIALLIEHNVLQSLGYHLISQETSKDKLLLSTGNGF
jgi:hypothetical protein